MHYPRSHLHVNVGEIVMTFIFLQLVSNEYMSILLQGIQTHALSPRPRFEIFLVHRGYRTAVKS